MVRITPHLLTASAAAIATLFAGCVQDSAPDANIVRVSIPLVGDQCGVASARAEVSAPDIDTLSATLDVSGNSIVGGVTNVPAGEDRVLTVEARNLRGQPVYSGTTTVDVVENQTTQANLVLRRNWQNCPGTGRAGDIEIIGNLDNTPPDGDVLTGNFSFTRARLTSNGVIYFLDGARVRRLDLATQTFLTPLVGTIGNFVTMAPTPDGSIVYVSYAGGRIDAIDTATGAARLFGTAPATVSGMVVAGDYLFVMDGSGAWASHALYDRATGQRVASDEWRHTGSDLVYSPATGKVFFVFNSVSPNDVGSVRIAAPGGPLLGEEEETPYHGDYSLMDPVRLTPDESAVIVGSGIHFRTSDLTYSTSFGLSFTDLVYHGELAHLLSASGGQSLIRTLDADFNVVGTRTVPGAPLRAFVHDGRLVVLTQAQSGFQVRFLDAAP